MNAQVTKTPVASAMLGNCDCPAETLAREIASAELALAEIDLAETQDVIVVAHARALERQFIDYISMKEAQLEWVRARTLSGVYAQALQLRGLMDDAQDEPGSVDSEAAARRFERLNDLVIEGLERVGGLDGDALGKRIKTVRGGAFEQVMKLVSDPG